MRKLFFVVCGLTAFFCMAGCNNTETYADQKKKERTAISQFLVDSAINVITESTFNLQGNATDVSRNEYVLFDASGVYMQIVRPGCGETIQPGEMVNVLCRFTEMNIMADSTILSNNFVAYATTPDKMSVMNTSGTFSAQFISGLMATAYESTAVPAGWLVPFPYIKVGRPASAEDEIAKVKLIVPHSQGQIYASRSVYPCYYEITFERGI